MHALKSRMILYLDMVHWDNSAHTEAFHNAKAHHWVEINGFDFISLLPKLDMYIDVIYPNIIVNPKLLEDLCLQPPALEDEEGGVTWGTLILWYY